MIIDKIGNRGTLFTFTEEDSPLGGAGNTAVYLINADKNMFLCDTHLGPSSMEHIKQYIKSQNKDKEIIVFNSHSDYDHIWGNCAFENEIIVAHAASMRRLEEKGEYDLERLNKYFNGKVILKTPNITFNSKLRFENDSIEFIYSPGHTIDSSVCFDFLDEVLFVGDLVEDPYPVINHYDLEGYIKTLEFIKKFPAKIIISAHSGVVNKELIENNISYISGLITKSMNSEDEEYKEQFEYDIKRVLIFEYENILRKKLEERFDYKLYKRAFSNFLGIQYEDLMQNEGLYICNTSYENLEKGLKECVSKL